MRPEESIALTESAWDVPGGIPTVGDALLGAVGALGVDLPTARLRPAGGTRSSIRYLEAAELDYDEQLAATNPCPAGAWERLGAPKATRVVVALIDGLGWHNLFARSEAAPFLTSAMSARRGAATAPTTTATNITYLGTGVRGGQTSMLGYTVRNPETGDRMNLISWSGGSDPLDWQRVPTIFERLAGTGKVGAHVSTSLFENSALTQAAFRGATYIGAETLPERVDATIEALTSGRVDLAYLYWSDVDGAGHAHGWEGEQWAAQLAHVDTEIARLAAGLPPDTLLLLTADHGMVQIPPTSRNFGTTARLDIAAVASLTRGVDLVAGENRYLHLFTKDPAAVKARWVADLGERAIVRTRAEAVDADLFGPVRGDVVPVMGDVMVAALGDMSLVDSRWMSPAAIAMPGLHGSLTELERCVPVLSLLT